LGFLSSQHSSETDSTTILKPAPKMYLFRFALLVLPLSTPLSLTRDHGARRSNCIDESTRKPSWNISDWSLDFTDPEQGGSLIFQLHNNAINYTTLCFRRGFLSQCFWTSGGTGDSAIDDLTETYFAFDEVTNKLDVNQTWACPGEPTETP